MGIPRDLTVWAREEKTLTGRFIVTGGAGFLGINLIRKLLQEGREVVSVDRAQFNYPELSRVTELKLDIRDLDNGFFKLHPDDILVHAAATLPLHSKKEIRSVDIHGTQNTLDWARSHGVQRFIFISSSAVYGYSGEPGQDESAPLLGEGHYAKAKIEAEIRAREYRKDMSVTILRPRSFIGPERLGIFSLLYDWAATGHNFPILGKGNNLYQHLDVSDLVELILLSSKAEESVASQTFNVGASEFGTFAEDMQSVLDDAGFGKRIIPIPDTPALFALRALSGLGVSPIYPWVYESAVRQSYISIEKARRELNFAPRYNNRDALIRNYRWYVENLNSLHSVSGLGHRAPWKQGAISAAKLLFR